MENLLNEAALHAVRNGRDKITSDDIEEARDKIIMGPRKIRKMRPEDIKLTAYHEAGHAFISLMYDGIADPIHKATIIPRGRALGMVQHLPIDDKVSMTLAEVRANLSIALAGRCAEEIFFGIVMQQIKNMQKQENFLLKNGKKLLTFARKIAFLNLHLLVENQLLEKTW